MEEQNFNSVRKRKSRLGNNKFLIPLVMAAMLIVGVQFGIMLGKNGADKQRAFAGSSYHKLKDVLNYIDAKYVDTIDRSALMNGLIDDVLSDLDPHSFYIPPANMDGVRENLQGNFEGIGIEFFIVEDTISVVSPIAGGPSEALGIMPGDKIIYIEDSVVAGKNITNQKVVSKLRGKKGTKVKVKIKRYGIAELLDYTITRDKIPLYSVDAGYMMDEETGYIKVNRFSASTHKEFLTKLRSLEGSGMKNLILDLRQNPGGYLNAATEMVDEFLDGKKLVVYTEGKAYERKDYLANRPGLFEEGQLIVLIDQGSASASEIVAGAVQDWDRGIIMGRRSFGKGLVQEQYELRDGSALRLTVARYFTPSGRSIQKPYNEGTEEYYSELAERFDNGELISEDSIEQDKLSLYYTAQGRKVYGGGGITPDIFVAVDTTMNYSYLNKVRRFIPEFIYGHYSSNAAVYDKYERLKDFQKGFDVPADLYAQFLDYAYEQGLDKDEAELGQLKLHITTTMKAYIARQKWKGDGYYPIINELDIVLDAAHEKILSGQLAN